MIVRSRFKGRTGLSLSTKDQLNNGFPSFFLRCPQVLLQYFVRFLIRIRSVFGRVPKVSTSEKRAADCDSVSRFCKFNLFKVTQLWYISDYPPNNTQPRMVLIAIDSLGFPFLISWPVFKVCISVIIKIEMSFDLEKSRFRSFSCGHLSLISALPISAIIWLKF